MSIKTGNLEAIAYHLEQGCDNGDVTREALALFLRGVAVEMERLTAENADLKRQLAECWAIIAKIDIAAPLADETCLEPGITLSEAVRRQLKATFDNGRSVERSIRESERGKGELG